MGKDLSWLHYWYSPLWWGRYGGRSGLGHQDFVAGLIYEAANRRHRAQTKTRSRYHLQHHILKHIQPPKSIFASQVLCLKGTTVPQPSTTGWRPVFQTREPIGSSETPRTSDHFSTPVSTDAQGLIVSDHLFSGQTFISLIVILSVSYLYAFSCYMAHFILQIFIESILSARFS